MYAYRSFKGFGVSVGPAEPSEDYLSGSYGCTFSLCPKSLYWKPFSGAKYCDKAHVWTHELYDAYSLGIEVFIHSIGPVLVFFQYHR